MNTDPLLAVVLHANRLKRVPRTGWVMRGVVDGESVSDHSFGVAFIALALAQVAEPDVDTTKLLTMALIHDMPEAVLSDIPSPALRHLSSDVKAMAERHVLGDLLAELPELEIWRVWWKELEERSSLEARLVRDADLLDMLLQAYVYEETTGNRWLEEFWRDVSPASFECPVSRSLFDALCEARRCAREAL